MRGSTSSSPPGTSGEAIDELSSLAIECPPPPSNPEQASLAGGSGLTDAPCFVGEDLGMLAEGEDGEENGGHRGAGDVEEQIPLDFLMFVPLRTHEKYLQEKCYAAYELFYAYYDFSVRMERRVSVVPCSVPNARRMENVLVTFPLFSLARCVLSKCLGWKRGERK